MATERDDIEAIGLLGEPVRRDLYEWVIGQGRPVGRDEAAAAVGVARALAAFHLDRLARAGLLETEYRRLSGRTGPGAGRPAKLYRRGDRDVAVALPDRRYEIPAELFAAALEDLAGSSPPEPLRSAARALGRAAGATARRATGPRPSNKRLTAAMVEFLTSRGYEPFDRQGREISLRNCPFHALVGDHRELVCGMNLALAEGMLGGLGGEVGTARLDPQPGHCCVVIETRAPDRHRP